MSGHTPGPWMIKRNVTKYELFSDDEMIAWVQPTLLPEDADNLRLIAAAPELLEELTECKRFLEDMHTQTVEWTIAESQVRYIAVSAAIAKATGATP